MKYTALTLTFVLCLVSLTTARPRRTQSVIAGKASAKTPTIATGAKAPATTTAKVGATSQAKASAIAPKAAVKANVKATTKTPAVILPKATGTVKVGGAPKAKATLAASADISGSTKASTPAKPVAPVVIDPKAGTCPQATYLEMKPFITMNAKALPFCPDLKYYCCHLDTMKTYYSEYLVWTQEISAVFWSYTKIPAVNGLYLSHLNSETMRGGENRRRLQTLTGNTSGSVKVNTGAKVGAKAQVNAGAQANAGGEVGAKVPVVATVPVVAAATADNGDAADENSVKKIKKRDRLSEG
jgi:hypothetical protein